MGLRTGQRLVFIILVFVLAAFMAMPLFAVIFSDLRTLADGMMEEEYGLAMDTAMIKKVYPGPSDVAWLENEEMLLEKAEIQVGNSGYGLDPSTGDETNSPVPDAKPESAADAEKFVEALRLKKEKDAAGSTQPFNDVVVDLGKRYRYEELEKLIYSLGTSDCSGLEIIGKSAGNRNIYNITIGSGTKTILLCAGIHARECSNPLYMVRFAAEMVQAYEGLKDFYGYDIKKLLSTYTFQILPCANPDGFQDVQFGARKFAGAKCNMNYVDLNRNFPSYSASVLWPGRKCNPLMSRKPALSYFAGNRLGSEPETQAVMRWMARYFNENTHIYIDFHSGGSIVYDSKPYVSSLRNATSRKAGKLFRKVSGYGQATDGTPGDGTNGTTTDYAYDITMGMIFDRTSGRMAPPGADELVTLRSNEPKYDFAILSVETLKRGLTQAPLNTSRKAKNGGHPTLGDQKAEWERARLPQAILAALEYRSI